VAQAIKHELPPTPNGFVEVWRVIVDDLKHQVSGLGLSECLFESVAFVLCSVALVASVSLWSLLLPPHALQTHHAHTHAHTHTHTHTQAADPTWVQPVQLPPSQQEKTE
jgi:hypothetical protein